MSEEDPIQLWDTVSEELYKARKKVLASHGLNESTLLELKEQAAVQVKAHGTVKVGSTIYSVETNHKLIAARKQ